MPQRTEHTHLHRHSVRHPDAFGHRVGVEHEHPHFHTGRERGLTNRPYHLMHTHTVAETDDLRRQQLGR